MTTVLLTGFEPFGGDSANPSGEAVELVAASWSGPERLVTAVLPVTFEDAGVRMRALLEDHQPDVLIATGLAAGRTAIGVERVALNLVDARIADNAGCQPVDVPSVAGAPAAHFANVPVKAIVRDIAAEGIPVELSHSAGTFVCNHVFFTAMDAAPSGTRVGFIHVPWTAETAPTTGVPLRHIVRALEVAVRTTLDVGEDIVRTAGAIH